MLRQVLTAIPLKSLSTSKSRLSSLLHPSERSLLTVSMLRDVLNAVKGSMTVSDAVLISPDSDVLRLADEFGVRGISQKGGGLNEAVSQIVEWGLDNGASSILILPSDVPLVASEDIDMIATLSSEPRSVVISPSLDGGTNAMFQHPPGVIPPCYGSDSFRTHLDLAIALRVRVEVYESPRLSLDIDSPEDLKAFLRNPSKTFTYKLLSELDLAKKFDA